MKLPRPNKYHPKNLNRSQRREKYNLLREAHLKSKESEAETALTKSRPATPDRCEQPLEGSDFLDFANPTKDDPIDDLTQQFDKTLSFRHLPQSTPKMEVKPNLAFNSDPFLYTSCTLLDNRIQKFSGDEERTFEEFLDDYTELVDRLGIPLEHAKSLMPLYLTGGAS